jgi:exo-beta-1,3-glucanase (GH17 family)
MISIVIKTKHGRWAPRWFAFAAAALILGLVFVTISLVSPARTTRAKPSVQATSRPLKGLCFSPFIGQGPSGTGGVIRQAATDSIGVSTPEKTWYLAEGSTGGDTTGSFETWVLVQNPGDSTANVTLTYQTPGGQVQGPSLSLAPRSRQSVSVGDTLKNAFSVSTVVNSDVPVIAERSMYWSTTLTAQRAEALVDTVAPYTNWIRTFSSTGIDADVVAHAKAIGLHVAGGCDISPDRAYNEAEVNGLIALAQQGKIDVAVVGEESLYFNYVSEQELIGYIRRVRATGIPTATSDTWNVLVGHPNVIAECDLLMANTFPYWENIGLDQSISRLDWSYQQIKAAAGGKQVVIETGWPSAGDPRGPAIASQANADSFLSQFMSWANANSVDYMYFEAFDEPWKAAHEGPVGAHWGIWDQNANLKPGTASILGNPQ